MTIDLNETGKLGKLDDGTYPVVLISPGKGSSGYYSEDVIRDYAPAAFPKGTHIYLGHKPKDQDYDTSKLLGVLNEDTVINEAGEATNRLLPLPRHAEWIDEVKSYVGLSINARGDSSVGLIDGEPTVIVESIDPAVTNTVDMVSFAGRGGRFLESYLAEANEAETEELNSTPGTPAEGTTEGNENMALEEQVANLVSIVESLVAKMTPDAAAEEELRESEAAKAADRTAFAEAMKTVASSELSESVRESLYKQIEAGDYDVNATITADKAYRDEVRAELLESGFVEAGASAGGSTATDLDVKGW